METKKRFEQARKLAITAHGDQRYRELPYEYHLQAVVDILKRFGANLEDESTAPLLVAAWLHDSLEDTSLTRTEVEAQFDFEIAELVWRVTDEPGATHKERKPATYRKTRESKAAIILKLADRIANVESSLASKSSLLRMYRREQDEFKQALKPMSNSEMTQRMWDHLDQLLA